ncbi:Seripauperin and TIP1 family protein [Saccharomyces cerevisiae]|nr:Seripauperin and TIP1 family protein [Saccharomyces cerevisiae]
MSCVKDEIWRICEVLKEHLLTNRLTYISTNKQNKYNGQINFNRCWCRCHRCYCFATTTLAQSDERVNLVELGVYVSDIRAHLAQYYMFQAAHPTETYPVEVAEAVFNYGDFTTMLTGIAPDQVTRMITGVPWYSSRLKPAISSALSKDGIYTIAN